MRPICRPLNLPVVRLMQKAPPQGAMVAVSPDAVRQVPTTRAAEITGHGKENSP